MKAEDVPFLPTKVVVDTYEPAGVFDHLQEWGLGAGKKYPLPFGDYWIRGRDGRLVVVERKHNDLASQWPRRLAMQLTKCRDGGADEIVLLVEGILDHDEETGRLRIPRRGLRKVWYDQVWGTILGWQETRGLKVYQCAEGEVEVARAVRGIYRHYRR
ncbi:hypothetical protein CMI37_03540 [Candidatus Pacearchaeota archaeon]|nr:hypothetical protein [Candidatus Pacearchaeota archaeon]